MGKAAIPKLVEGKISTDNKTGKKRLARIDADDAFSILNDQSRREMFIRKKQELQAAWKKLEAEEKASE